MGNDAQSNVASIGDIQIKTHDGIMKTLTNVLHIPDLKCNLISLVNLESNGCRYSVDNEALKVSKDALVLLKGVRCRSPYIYKALL